MTSPTAKKTLVELTEQLMWHQEAGAKLAAQNNQTNRVLWLTVKAAGGKVTLDEASIPPLWKIEKYREGTKLILEAQTMEMPSEGQVKTLCEKLMGTNLEIGSLQKELQLEVYPANWLAIYISDRVVLMDGTWQPAAIVKAATRQNEQN